MSKTSDDSQHVGAPVEQWPGHTGTWKKWPNDRGALNYITPDVVRAATAEVKKGKTIACARPIRTTDPANSSIVPASRRMIYLRETGPRGTDNSAGDEISFRTHGMLNTHIDAFSHVGYRGRGYNGHPFSDMINMEDGATLCDITDLLGIVTRGVFFDVARRRGVRGLTPGTYVVPEDLTELLEVLQPGDAAVIRTGVTLTGGEAGVREADGSPSVHYPIAGFHADCIEVLAARGISVLASDSPSDAYPSPLGDVCGSPVHRLCLTFYGIPLVHNLDLEELGDEIAGEAGGGPRKFLFMVSALNMKGATGSPCTPLAVL
jgi:kynurenine formamidase